MMNRMRTDGDRESWLYLVDLLDPDPANNRGLIEIDLGERHNAFIIAYELLLKYAKQVVNSHRFPTMSEPEDLASKMLIKLFNPAQANQNKLLKNLRRVKTPAGYLLRSIKNMLIEEGRSRNRQSELYQEYTITHSSKTEIDNTTKNIDVDEISSVIIKALHNLKQDDLNIIKLKLEGLDTPELARRFDVKYSVMAVRITRAVRRFNDFVSQSPIQHSFSNEDFVKLLSGNLDKILSKLTFDSDDLK